MSAVFCLDRGLARRLRNMEHPPEHCDLVGIERPKLSGLPVNGHTRAPAAPHFALPIKFGPAV
jgi:hypothetical protein